MSNLPALPNLASASATSQLAKQLRAACGGRLNATLDVSQSTSDQWLLSASTDLTAGELEDALKQATAMDIFLVPCDEDEAENAVQELKVMTARPSWMDGEDAGVYEEALISACLAYPLDVVQTACRAWRQVPNHGKWWPTEQDLRAQCEAAFRPRKALFNKARMLLMDLRSKEAAARETNERSAYATDAGRAFREEMRKRFKPARFDAYFHPSQVMYQEGVVHVRTQTAEHVLTEEGRDLLERYRLRVQYNPQAFVNVRAPTWEDDTPEERAEVTKKLNRLNEAMAKGEDLKRLRQEGAI